MSSKPKSTAIKEEAKPALVPKLRFPEFRGAKEWTGEKLGSKTKKVGSGITPTGGEKNYKQSGRPFVRSQNVGWGELLLNDVALIDEETHNTFSSTQIAVFDVLLNITGASIGRSAVADERIEGGNVNQHVCIIRVKPDELSPIFLNQYFISHDGQKQIDSFQAGGNRQGLNFEQIRSFLIPLPPTPAEQQKIAECLSSVDELMAAQARKVDALKTHKKGLMQQLFPREGETQPRLRFPEFQNAGEWEETTIGDLKPFVTSGSRGWAPFYAEKGELFVRITNLWRDSIYLDLTDCKYVQLPPGANEGVRTQLKEHDVLISITADIGIVGYVDDSVPSPAYINQHIALVRFNEGQLCSKYVAYFLASEESQRLFRASTDTGTKAGMSLIGIQKIGLKLPTLPEQQRIAECLSSLDALITAETQQLEAIKIHKKGLMQQLFPSPEEVEA